MNVWLGCQYNSCGSCLQHVSSALQILTPCMGTKWKLVLFYFIKQTYAMFQYV